MDEAIPMSRYVEITSMNIGDSAISDRDLGGLVFTYGKGWSVTTEPFLPGNIVIVHSAAQALMYFASDSAEYQFANRYFSYLSTNGDLPRTLSFVRMSATSGDDILTWRKEGTSDPAWYKSVLSDETWTYEALGSGDTVVLETPAVALARVGASTNNFGSFCFIDADTITCKQLKDVADANKVLNYRYLLAVSAIGTTSATVTDGMLIGEATAADLATYLGETKGVALVKGDSIVSSEMPMAIFGATDYSGVNTAPNHMYKQFSSETPTVFTEAVAYVLDGKCVNYIGRVQANGSARSFYQRGHNLDREDTAVYCNEIWLKSAISTAILDYQLTVNRIPANSTGNAALYSIVSSIAADGLRNGTIEAGKTLTTAMRLKVTQTTGNPDAWKSVEADGYYLSVVIVFDETKNEYKAVYRLAYGKGDSVKFVEGHDYLV